MYRFYSSAITSRTLIVKPDGSIFTNAGITRGDHIAETYDYSNAIEFANTEDERTYYRSSFAVLQPSGFTLSDITTRRRPTVSYESGFYALPRSWLRPIETYRVVMSFAGADRDRGCGTGSRVAKRVFRANLAALVRETLKEMREECHCRDELNTLAEKMNYGRSFGWLSRETMVAICKATETTHDGGPAYNYLVVADCGHAEIDDSTGDLHNGDTYCEACSGEVVEVDGDNYYRSSVYYWSSDGEYHTDPEPEDDEDDEDDGDGSGSIYSWGSNSGRTVRHDEVMLGQLSSVSDFPMGLEIEVESKSGQRGNAADDTLYQLNDGGNDGYVMLKEDGSLSDYGFEIVTGARSLKHHRKVLKAWAPHSSLKAWDAGNCGTHVHIDSRVFTPMTLGKLLVFINSSNNVGLIKKVAGRHPVDSSQASSYCGQLGASEVVNPKAALKGGNATRYRMVNLCNLSEREAERLEVDNHNRDSKGSYTTVELRIFRASLKKERLLAQIEFAHACVGFVRVASMAALTEQGFRDWLAGVAGAYKNLARFLGINVPKTNKKNPTATAVCYDETV